MVEKMVFQFVRSVSSPGGNDAESNCGKDSPDNKFVDVVGDSSRPFARFCSAVGSESMNWVSSVPMFDAVEVLSPGSPRPLASARPRRWWSAAAR